MKIRVFGLFVTLALLAACGRSITVPPLTAEEAVQFEQAGNFPDRNYRLQPGDTLDIKFPFHPEMDRKVLVREDGRISVQQVGEVQASGIGAHELEEALKKKSSKNLRDPEVRVTIREFAPRNVFVTGEVGRPGLVEYQKDLTALQAVIRAGGFLDTSLTDNVILIRAANDDRMISRTVNLEETVSQEMERALRLAPNDVVYVPRTKIAEADLWVDQHITRLFPFIKGAGARFPLGF